MPRKRENRITVRLTDEEYEKFIKLVEKSKMSQQDYLLKAALKKKITVIEGIGNLVEQVRKIGININQVVKLSNENKYVTDSEVNKIIELLIDIWNLLNDFLKSINK